MQRAGRREGAAHVVPAFAQRQVRLLARGAPALEQRAIERQRQRARREAREFGRLVVAALAQAQRVQRHRHHEVGERRGAAGALEREQRAQQPCVRAFAVEFQRAHQRIDRECVTPGAADVREARRLEGIAPIDARQFREAAGAQVDRPG
ncbi:MAG: hypothetical protein JSR15_00060 [Proteobacteria bacterium]|nr:hypothetical protein [Pseudomonadota bacterium]